MKIEEAIETNSKIKWYVEERIGKAHAEALQLGIEALERIKWLRENHILMMRSDVVDVIQSDLPSEEE